jgi:uncharacterized integral membrane protein
VRVLSFLIGLPLIVVVAVFAVVNREDIAINLWPLRESVTLPLPVVVLGGVAIGLLVGAAIGWLSAGPARRRVREERARVRALEARLAEMARQQAAAGEMRPEGGGWLRLAGGRS